MLIRKQTRLTGVIAVLCCTLIPAWTHAQIVSGATGTIDLQLNPYWDHIPGTDEPTSSMNVSVPVGLDEAHPVLDQRGSYNASGIGGISLIDYEYLSLGPGEARFNIHAFADTLERDRGGGGNASLNVSLTLSAPFRYRFEAETVGAVVLYEVSFNDTSAYASYDIYFGGYFGTFPIRYYEEEGYEPFSVGWHPYSDEGILSAGTYSFSVETISTIHGRYGVGISSEGSASLHIQLLGDADLDGAVGIADMNIILANWNTQVPAYARDSGDLDGDGVVGIADLNEVLGGWGSDVRPVPEPAAILLAPALLLTITGRQQLRPTT